MSGAWIVAALRFIVICITHGRKRQNFPSNFTQFYHYLWIYPTDRFSCLRSKPVRHDTDRWLMFSNPRYPTRLWIMMMMLFGFGLVMELRRFHYRVIQKLRVCSFLPPKWPKLGLVGSWTLLANLSNPISIGVSDVLLGTRTCLLAWNLCKKFPGKVQKMQNRNKSCDTSIV